MTGRDPMGLVRNVLQAVGAVPADRIGPDTRLAELGVDSIALAEIVVRLEDEAGIDVPLERWLRARNVADVLDLIEQAPRRH